MFWLGGGIGLFVGTIVGITVIAFCQAAKRGDQQMR